MGSLRTIIKKITHPFLKKGAEYYYKKPRPYSYNGITTIVHPDVFPPHLTLSTKILLDFISEIELTQKTFLELGCGSGIISLFASQKGAKVTASDINKTALEYLTKASEKNELLVNCVYSNLFENIPKESFNYIIINPPYYPKSPESIKQQAWFCGEDFEYFKSLFKQLPSYLSEENTTYMILSEDCELEKIKGIASENNITMELIFETKKMAEKNFIFSIYQK
jgi:release factor glutamine methyltransferase